MKIHLIPRLNVVKRKIKRRKSEQRKPKKQLLNLQVKMSSQRKLPPVGVKKNKSRQRIQMMPRSPFLNRSRKRAHVVLVLLQAKTNLNHPRQLEISPLLHLSRSHKLSRLSPRLKLLQGDKLCPPRPQATFSRIIIMCRICLTLERRSLSRRRRMQQLQVIGAMMTGAISVRLPRPSRLLNSRSSSLSSSSSQFNNNSLPSNPLLNSQ